MTGKNQLYFLPDHLSLDGGKNPFFQFSLGMEGLKKPSGDFFGAYYFFSKCTTTKGNFFSTPALEFSSKQFSSSSLFKANGEGLKYSTFSSSLQLNC